VAAVVIRSSWTVIEGEVQQIGGRRKQGNGGRERQRAKIRQRVKATGSTTILGAK
jgi:hypothetical protein